MPTFDNRCADKHTASYKRQLFPPPDIGVNHGGYGGTRPPRILSGVMIYAYAPRLLVCLLKHALRPNFTKATLPASFLASTNAWYPTTFLLLLLLLGITVLLTLTAYNSKTIPSRPNVTLQNKNRKSTATSGVLIRRPEVPEIARGTFGTRYLRNRCSWLVSLYLQYQCRCMHVWT